MSAAVSAHAARPSLGPLGFCFWGRIPRWQITQLPCASPGSWGGGRGWLGPPESGYRHMAGGVGSPTEQAEQEPEGGGDGRPLRNVLEEICQDLEGGLDSGWDSEPDVDDEVLPPVSAVNSHEPTQCPGFVVSKRPWQGNLVPVLVSRAGEQSTPVCWRLVSQVALSWRPFLVWPQPLGASRRLALTPALLARALWPDGSVALSGDRKAT